MRRFTIRYGLLQTLGIVGGEQKDDGEIGTGLVNGASSISKEIGAVLLIVDYPETDVIALYIQGHTENGSPMGTYALPRFLLRLEPVFFASLWLIPTLRPYPMTEPNQVRGQMNFLF